MYQESLNYVDSYESLEKYSDKYNCTVSNMTRDTCEYNCDEWGDD